MRHRLRKAWRFGIVLAFLTVSIAVLVPPASAVHDAGIMELDVDVPNDIGDGNLVDGPAGGAEDWADVFTVNASGDIVRNGGGKPVIDDAPPGFINASFVRDFVPGAAGPDPTYFEPSSKDDQSIKSTGGSSVWACVEAANPTDKNEILNAYALASRVPNDGAGGTFPDSDHGDLIIYVGGERFDNEGTAYIGIWFFQSTVSCPGESKFTGQKTDGDILLLVNFSSGGDDISIDAFKWRPCNAPGSPIKAANCKKPTEDAGFFLGGIGGGDCADSVGSDNICAVTNQGVITTPWKAQDKDLGPNQLDAAEFFEVGFNLTDAFGQQSAGNGIPGTEPCISSFLMETRSSDTLTATLKDFAGGEFDTCVDVTALKYHDENADGNRDSGEDPLAGWTLFIDQNANGVKNTGEPSGVTNSSGLVTFAGLQSASFTVCEELLSATPRWYNSDPAGETPTNTGSLAATARCKTGITATDDGQPDAVFGNYQTASKSGRKFEDLNGNGADNSEPPLVVEIHIFGTDNLGNTVHRHTLTNGTSGNYSFADLVPGSYTVCETPLSNYTQTAPSTGANCNSHADNADSLGAGGGTGYAITLTSGEADTGNDFGNAPQHRIIVLVCHENSTGDTLSSAAVTVDGVTKNSIHDSPITGVSENDLCDLGGATFGNKLHETESASIVIGTGTNSGH